jgi:two-component system chemotaxis sensor kinase CheA
VTPRDPEMTAVVHREVSEALEALLELFEAARAGTTAPSELTRGCFRIFHNIKGALRLGGFPEPEQLAHRVEDHLAELRASGRAPPPALIEVMEQAIGVCLQAIEAGGDHPVLVDVADRLERVAAADAPPGAGDEAPAPRSPEVAPRAASGAGEAAVDRGPADPPAPAPGPSRALGRDDVRIDARRLDRLMDLGSEYLAQHARAAERRERLRELADRARALLRRLPAERDHVGPLAAALEAFVREDEQDGRRAAQLHADFDHAMRAVRMMPLATMVPVLRRTVADVSQELGKAARLVADHGDVELDREVLDALREPLLHLVRNAIDHGVEPDDERRAAGKPPIGEVRITARVSGAHVELRVSDDGRGIDAARVRARAAELGLVDGAGTEVASLDDALFAPGLSTASSVTSVSGRGVGLDAVRSRVAALGGHASSVTPERGAGATFVISVPASVVSLRGLAVRLGETTVVVPSIHVERTLRVETASIESSEGTSVALTPEGEPLALRWLAPALGLPRAPDGATVQVVVVAAGGQRVGLVVDRVQQDTGFVIKRLPWNVQRAPGIVGVTHLGDAALALVVDVAHVLRHRAARPDDERPRTVARASRPRVLVADDSLTSRTLERNILAAAGYDVTVVEDGDQALRALREGDFHLLVSDVQMPVLDGLELTRAVRADARLARLPVILVTSLEREEDVAEGAAAGADEYVVKGQFDQEALLAAVSRLL